MWSSIKPLHRGSGGGFFLQPQRLFQIGISFQLILVLASAWLWALSMGGTGYGWLAWVALIPFLIALRVVSVLRAVLLGYVAGLCFFLVAARWITEVGGVRWYDFLLLASYFGAYLAFFAGIYALANFRRDGPAVFLAPALWVTMEFAWSHAGFLTVPTLIAYSQYQNSVVLQISSVTGPYGVSFLIVMVNALGANLVRATRPSRREWLYVVLVLTGSLGFGIWRLSTPGNAGTLTIAVVQANIPQDLKWEKALYRQHLEKHVRLTREAVERNSPALIIWPESAVPGYLTGFGPFRDVSVLAKEFETHLLVGGAGLPKSAKERAAALSFNAAYLVSENGLLVGEYRKRRLVPFAEYLPMRDSFPWPERFTRGRGSFIPGEEIKIFTVEGEPIAALICWETLFPDLVRETSLAGANILVNIGNEAWFGDTAAPFQFFAANVFRAVENGITVVRSLNTGVSGFIDPYGRVMATVSENREETFVAGYASARVAIVRDRTFYTRHGDVFAYAIAGLGLFLLLRILRRRSSQSLRQ